MIPRLGILNTVLSRSIKMKIVEFKSGETDWVVANSFDEAVAHARDELDDMAEGLDSGDVIARELTDQEAKELQIRVEDADYKLGTEDKYSSAIEHIESEIQAGRVLPFHFMATYF
jgi:hypothetical protein